MQVHPNPVNRNTTLSFHLPVKTDVLLSVYDLSGKAIWSALYKGLAAGDHQYRLNAAAILGESRQGGVYFIRLKAETLEESKKILVLK
jgi:hypothetical protein